MNEALEKYLAGLNAKPIDQSTIEKYRNDMVTEVIPVIAKAVKERQRLAAESRLWPVKRPRLPSAE